MQIELGRIACQERDEDRLVPERRATIRLVEAGDFVVGLLRPQRIQRLEESRRIDALRREPPRIGPLAVLPDERDVRAARKVILGLLDRVDLDDLEGVFVVFALDGGEFLPNVHRPEAHELRSLPRLDDERAVGLGEREPVLKVRRDPEREVLVVVDALRLLRAGVDDDGVDAAGGERARVPGFERRDVGAVEIGESLGHPATLPHQSFALNARAEMCAMRRSRVKSWSGFVSSM